MTATRLYRIAALLLLIFAVGHTRLADGDPLGPAHHLPGLGGVPGALGEGRHPPPSPKGGKGVAARVRCA
jgi:hypothetical protein